MPLAGCGPTRDGFETREDNPIGCGFISAEHTDRHARLPAPQIEQLDAPYTVLEDVIAPAGFGPIPPAWMPRRPLGGTYDQRWVDDVWPHWAEDYDFAFHNSAPRDMQFPGFLAGDERVTLTNLWPGGGVREINLPGETVVATLSGEAGPRRVGMNLDTLYMDLTAGAEGAAIVTLSWRLVFRNASVAEVSIGRAEAVAPHPSDLFEADEVLAHVE